MCGREAKTLLNFCVMDETAVSAVGLSCVAGKTKMGQAGVVFRGVDWRGFGGPGDGRRTGGGRMGRWDGRGGPGIGDWV